jgi:uncharacterized protein
MLGTGWIRGLYAGAVLDTEAAVEHWEEVHCAANRRPEHIAHEAVSEVLSAMALVDIESGDLTTAPLLPGRLGSADAIHLATALRLNARAMVSYDAELRAASRTAGIDAVSPGAD